MTKQTKEHIRPRIATGGTAIPNPLYAGLEFPALQEKLGELEGVAKQIAALGREIGELEREAQTAPQRVARERAEALIKGNTAVAVEDPTEGIQREIAEKKRIQAQLEGPIKRRVRGEIEAAELKSMEEVGRRRELQAEISEIDARREFALKVLGFLRAPDRPVTGSYGPRG